MTFLTLKKQICSRIFCVTLKTYSLFPLILMIQTLSLSSCHYINTCSIIIMTSTSFIMPPPNRLEAYMFLSCPSVHPSVGPSVCQRWFSVCISRGQIKYHFKKMYFCFLFICEIIHNPLIFPGGPYKICEGSYCYSKVFADIQDCQK